MLRTTDRAIFDAHMKEHWTGDDLREKLDLDPEALFCDGFDDCILGAVERCSQPSIVAYDARKIIAKLCKQGLSEEEAMEHFSFNISGAWMGEYTPCFVWLVEEPPPPPEFNPKPDFGGPGGA
jgi:hypothetical protein